VITKLKRPTFEDKVAQREANKLGRPTEYHSYMDVQTYNLCLLGAKDQEIANFHQVDIVTIYKWRAAHQSFDNALKDGRENADAYIAKSLFHRAKGYSHKVEKIFCTKGGEIVRAEYVEHYAPDPTSCIFWLKNRRPDLWRDRHLEVAVNTNPDPNDPNVGVAVKIIGGLPD
jgi:hypothetical protein